MLYADNPRVHYDRPQLAEVICQLRFPAILSIGAKEPAEFQEAVRAIFPRYAAKREQPAPKITGLGTPNARLEQAQPITNYNFISADGKWKLNLTQNFISLSTVAYPGWEHFGQQLDLPLAQFIRIYKPAFFERIGLRYVNIFSRKALELEEEPWRELMAPAYKKADLERIYRETLIDSYCPNIEIWDKQLFQILCPGKEKWIGHDEWVKRTLEAVEVFGKGKVFTQVVAGAELAAPHGFSSVEEALESNFEACDFYAKNGVIYLSTIWRPHRAARLGRASSFTAKRQQSASGRASRWSVASQCRVPAKACAAASVRLNTPLIR